MKNKILNTSYLLFVFTLTLLIGSLGLARRVNSYKTNSDVMVFKVDKDNILISNSVVGKIENIYVRPGQKVKAGDLLIELSDQSFQARLSTLERFAGENLSALTQAQLLRAERDQFQLLAPRDGTVYELHQAKGAYVPVNTPIVTMYADNDVRLVTLMDPKQLEIIQRVHTLDVFSPRLEQSFKISFLAVGKVITDKEQGDQYEVVFQFDNPQESSVFLEGETVEVVGVSSDKAKRPADVITDIWNKLIIGN